MARRVLWGRCGGRRFRWAGVCERGLDWIGEGEVGFLEGRGGGGGGWKGVIPTCPTIVKPTGISSWSSSGRMAVMISSTAIRLGYLEEGGGERTYGSSSTRISIQGRSS